MLPDKGQGLREKVTSLWSQVHLPLDELRFHVSRFKQDEYVGENRCMPCTIVNCILAVVLAVWVLLIVETLSSLLIGVLIGGCVFVIACGAIYLRGYLVPGTPTLTARYLPDLILKRFDKEHDENGFTVTDDSDPSAEGIPDPVLFLDDIGVVTECDDVDDLCLTDEFRTPWERKIRDVRSDGIDKRELGRAIGVNGQSLTFDTYGDSFNARIHGNRVGQWESRAALIADLAASEVLASQCAEWNSLVADARGSILYSLRAFLETCPECDSLVTPERETVESCCRTVEVVAISCDNCDARLMEVEAQES